jgi:hypothetical protein
MKLCLLILITLAPDTHSANETAPFMATSAKMQLLESPFFFNSSPIYQHFAGIEYLYERGGHWLISDKIGLQVINR